MSEHTWRYAARTSAAGIVLLGTAEVLMMISPFAGYFYAAFRPALNFISEQPLTAWLNGFFLNHALITTSPLLEGQRLVGKYLFAAGMWGFLIAFLQVYVAKILRRPGVVRWGLYRLVRHPQYSCLIIAGWGLLTIWPRFLLLALYVTMIFLYILLAHLEEMRMEEKFPTAWRAYRQGRGAFLPGSPGGWIFARTLGRLDNRPLGFLLLYLICLTGSLAGGLGTMAYVRARTAWTTLPEERIVGLSVWPRSDEEIRSIMDRVLGLPEVREKMSEDGGPNFVAHILPSDYGMLGMYAVMPRPEKKRTFWGQVKRTGRLAAIFLFPKRPGPTGRALMGRPIDRLMVVISRSSKPFRPEMPLEESLDAGVKLRPVIIVRLHAKEQGTPTIEVPLPRNAWGDIAMPIF